MPEYSTVVWYGGKGERMQEQHPARFSGLCVHPNRDGRCAWLFEPNHPAMARPYTFREQEKEPEGADLDTVLGKEGADAVAVGA